MTGFRFSRCRVQGENPGPNCSDWWSVVKESKSKMPMWRTRKIPVPNFCRTEPFEGLRQESRNNSGFCLSRVRNIETPAFHRDYWSRYPPEKGFSRVRKTARSQRPKITRNKQARSSRRLVYLAILFLLEGVRGLCPRARKE